MLVLKTHKKCNKQFQYDEDYFVQSIIPLIQKSYAGNSLFYERILKNNSGRDRKLAFQVLHEFEKEPQGIILPENKIAKRFDMKRLKNVGFKIARGLIFYNENLYIDPASTHTISDFNLGDRKPKDYDLISLLKPKGQYPNVFDYKYAISDDLCFISMLLFDQLVLSLYISLDKSNQI